MFIQSIIKSMGRGFKEYTNHLNPQDGIRVIQKKKLHTKITLYLLECHQQRFLLVDNKQTITLQAITGDSFTSKGGNHDLA